jgi:hypothetical protein
MEPKRIIDIESSEYFNFVHFLHANFTAKTRKKLCITCWLFYFPNQENLHELPLHDTLTQSFKNIETFMSLDDKHSKWATRVRHFYSPDYKIRNFTNHSFSTESMLIFINIEKYSSKFDHNTPRAKCFRESSGTYKYKDINSIDDTKDHILNISDGELIKGNEVLLSKDKFTKTTPSKQGKNYESFTSYYEDNYDAKFSDKNKNTIQDKSKQPSNTDTDEEEAHFGEILEDSKGYIYDEDDNSEIHNSKKKNKLNTNFQKCYCQSLKNKKDDTDSVISFMRTKFAELDHKLEDIRRDQEISNNEVKILKECLHLTKII